MFGKTGIQLAPIFRWEPHTEIVHGCMKLEKDWEWEGENRSRENEISLLSSIFVCLFLRMWNVGMQPWHNIFLILMFSLHFWRKLFEGTSTINKQLFVARKWKWKQYFQKTTIRILIALCSVFTGRYCLLSEVTHIEPPLPFTPGILTEYFA